MSGASFVLWAQVEETQAFFVSKTRRSRDSETATFALPLDRVMSSSLRHSASFEEKPLLVAFYIPDAKCVAKRSGKE